MRTQIVKSYPGFVHVLAVCFLVLLSVTAYSAPASKDAKKAEIKRSTTNSEVVIPLSVFVVPQTPKDGKDPFFPASTRPYVNLQPIVKGQKPQVIEVPLTLTGIIPLKLAMVNGRTFSEGEEGEVVVNGTRKKIRCVKVKQECAIVELLPEGERRELKMRFGAQIHKRPGCIFG
jgi:hypothetical protein